MIDRITYLFKNMKVGDPFFSIYTKERECNSIHISKLPDFYFIEFEFGGYQEINNIEQLFDIIGTDEITNIQCK